MVGASHNIVNSGVHPPSFWAEVWRTISSNQPWRGEVCNMAKDGSFYWVDSMIAPFPDQHGAIERYISIRLDITARKTLEQELSERNQLLQNILEKSVRELGAIRRVDGAARVSLRHSSCNR